MAKIQKITPFLWFDKQSEAAAKFYVSIFKNSRITHVSRYAKGSPFKAGTVATVGFKLDGQDFTAINGGKTYKINPAVSFVIACANQKELDYYWSKLTSGGGKAVQCGWLEDKFGVSWQVVPAKIWDWIASKNRRKADAVMQAVWRMVKLDVRELEKAYKEG